MRTDRTIFVHSADRVKVLRERTLMDQKMSFAQKGWPALRGCQKYASGSFREFKLGACVEAEAGPDWLG